MYKLGFYVPEDALETVKAALFNAGAGRIGDYEHCCWQTLGTGQFRPLAGAQPHLGELGKLEKVDEWRVELVCADSEVKAVMAALKQTHPYEEPAYDLCRLEQL
ncbi:YqfO family protein [Agaribacterium haliotis]|uniref:Nif3-like dinuclear metal center hexameric protein n=1 Tax=Agaribacterium haliotis TaxID=2013869 RepID=UPI000BB55632|nr:YqfO family protein [Agaribacterium haliotis]